VAYILYHLPPRHIYQGPPTPSGARPTYHDNGMAHLFGFILAYFAGSEYLRLYRLDILVTSFVPLLGLLNIFALLFCVWLTYVGLHSKSPDNGTNGKGILYDYFAGTVLHPRAFGVDLKLFINSRFSMTFWFVFQLSALATPSDVARPGLVFCALGNMLYLVGFFMQEKHYTSTIDIIEDSAGFYETYGCLSWVPSIYTLHTRVAIAAVDQWSWTAASIIFVVSALGWALNWWTNEERSIFRRNPESYCPRPFTQPGKVARSIVVPRPDGSSAYLLVDGWWRVVRKPQYIFELISAWSWGVLAMGGTWLDLVGFFYPFYLTILLLHRIERDHRRCLAKYGTYFEEYCQIVPYKLIPGVY